jgi:hypothetical protein
LTRDINQANDPEVIRQLLHDAAGISGLYVRTAENVLDISGPNPTRDAVTGRFVSQSDKAEPGEPQTFSKTANIAGREMAFEASSALEVEQLIRQAHQVAEALQPESSNSSGDRHNEESEEMRIVRQSELELRFKRGEISAADYLRQSGAVDDYLESKGISVDALKETVQEKANTAFVQSWSEATEIFKNGVGADWPGGQNNLQLIGLKIAELGLVDATDKAGALATAYAEMKRTGLIFSPEHDEQKAVEDALKNASPQEIIQSWKESLLTQGKSIDEANDGFVRSFSKTSSGIFGR